MSNWLQPHVVGALLGAVGVVLVLFSAVIQRRIVRWHQRLRRASHAPSWLVRVTGWHHETALILFGLLFAGGGLVLFLLTYPWDEVR